MKIRFYRWYNGLLASLLALLGYSCSPEPDEYGPPPVEYGAPTVEFRLKGHVNDEDGKTVQGIKVKVQELLGNNEWFNLDSVKTDANGKYQLPFRLTASNEKGLKYCRLTVEDTDGAENGEFKNDTINLNDAEAKKIKDKDGWFNGAYEVNVDVKLKKK
jgi:putative lipoprotein (rSAM/lipoprotein system)